jgi:hypothetical protein
MLEADVASLGGDLAAWHPEARAHALAALLHAADMSNAAKPPHLCTEWARRVIEGARARRRRRGPVRAWRPVWARTSARQLARGPR